MFVRIGLDVGGVIRMDSAGNKTPVDDESFMARAAVEGAFDAVRQIVAAFGTEQVFIISKCRETTALRLREWLARKDFYVETGFSVANLNFCRERADKAPIAARLGLTHFVDDHTEVLECMRGIVRYLYLFGPRMHRRDIASDLIGVLTWEVALEAILSRK